jgi:hypothetical protein
MNKLQLNHNPIPKRGIIYTSYSKVFNQTILSIYTIRELNCLLDIEVWHYGNDLTESEIMEFTHLNVTVVDLKSLMKNQFNHVNDKMYEVKGGALIYTNFTEILYLDSDNIPLRDPTFLFDTKEYDEYGAIFWPDYWKTSGFNPIWSILQIECSPEYEQESGQLVLNKTRLLILRGLHLAFYMQLNREFYFSFLLGDKDTFRFGFKALGVEYFMVKVHVGTVAFMDAIGYCGHSILQYESFDNNIPKPMFLHVNTLKGTSLNNHEAFQVIMRYDDQFTPISKTSYRPYIGSNLHSILTGMGCTVMRDDTSRVIIEDFDSKIPWLKPLYTKMESMLIL